MSFLSNTRYRVFSTCNCTSGIRTISGSNIIIEGQGDLGVSIAPSADGTDLFNITGSNIAIKNFRLMPRSNGTVRFRQPIFIRNTASNVTIENVTIDRPTNPGITIAGTNTCLRGTTVMGAVGANDEVRNGYLGACRSNGARGCGYKPG